MDPTSFGKMTADPNDMSLRVGALYKWDMALSVHLSTDNDKFVGVFETNKWEFAIGNR